MKQIEFSKEERADIVARIQRHFDAEMGERIGDLPAEMLLAFFTEAIGPFYYNQGLADARAVLAKSVDDINDRIYALEQHEAHVR